jgi:adenylate cyclase
VEPEVLARCKEAGLYDPASPRAAEREELLDDLVGRFGLEPVLEAGRRLPLFTVAIELSHPGRAPLSARAVAEQTGLALEDVLLLRSAVGKPVDDVDEPIVAATGVEDAASFAAAVELFGREPTLAFVRVLGRVSQQVANAARALFANAVVDGAGPEAVTELALSQANEVAWAAYVSIPAVLEHMLLERIDSGQDLIARIVEGDVRLAVAFVDLVGSTAWTVATDPHRHAAALARFEQAAWETAVANRGLLVKLIGDEAMVVADDAEAACGIATGLCAHAAADPDLPDARGGVAWGDVVARGGDYFGSVVNLAARLPGQADPGAVVVTSEVVDRLDPDRWSIGARATAELKGVPAPVHLFTVSPSQ